MAYYTRVRIPSGRNFIAVYRGRTVLSGVVAKPQNWLTSKASDPNSFEVAAAASGGDDENTRTGKGSTPTRP